MSHRPAMRRLLGLLVAWVVLLGPAGAGAEPLTVSSGSGDHRFEVEMAVSAVDKARGLMFRQSLAPDAGMLFVYQRPQPVSFWMRNTLIPLDILFIGKDGRIARIHRRARPLDDTPIPSGGPIRGVLEIPGGRAAELGLAVGDRVIGPLLP